MTHALITFLKTPMAAPETPRLRHMRRWWMALCWALALAVPVHGMFYFRAKLRADDHFSGEGQP